MESSKKLIVYYSYTGHTKMIAERIKEKIYQEKQQNHLQLMQGGWDKHLKK